MLHVVILSVVRLQALFKMVGIKFLNPVRFAVELKSDKPVAGIDAAGVSKKLTSSTSDETGNWQNFYHRFIKRLEDRINSAFSFLCLPYC